MDRAISRRRPRRRHYVRHRPAGSCGNWLKPFPTC